MKTILVPTDFSENAHHALHLALYLNEQADFKIIVFHWTEILIPTSTPHHLYKELYEEQFQSKLQILQKETSTFLSKNGHKKDNLEFVLKDGASLQETLLTVVKEREVDVVFMGTHGASGMKKLLFGSNTTTVIDKAQVPVIAVPADAPLKSIQKIGYASDLKDVVKEVGELVAFAKLFGASIEIFHIYPTYPQWVEISQENINSLVEQLNSTYRDQQFSIHVIQTYKENDVVHGIETYMKSFKPDILAMFTVKRTFWDKLFDASRTEEIAFNTHLPLLTLKKFEDNPL